VIGSIVTTGRKRAEARFTETFEFFTVTLTPVSGQIDPTRTETVLWSGAGRWKNVNVISRDEVTGQQIVTKARSEISVAVGTHEGQPGEFVRCLSSTEDAALVGRVVIVRDRPSRGQVTAWRHGVEEIAGG
jgi:hypothetical protein